MCTRHSLTCYIDLLYNPRWSLGPGAGSADARHVLKERTVATSPSAIKEHQNAWTKNTSRARPRSRRLRRPPGMLLPAPACPTLPPLPDLRRPGLPAHALQVLRKAPGVDVKAAAHAAYSVHGEGRVPPAHTRAAQQGRRRGVCVHNAPACVWTPRGVLSGEHSH